MEEITNTQLEILSQRFVNLVGIIIFPLKKNSLSIKFDDRSVIEDVSKQQIIDERNNFNELLQNQPFKTLIINNFYDLDALYIIFERYAKQNEYLKKNEHLDLLFLRFRDHVKSLGIIPIKETQKNLNADTLIGNLDNITYRIEIVNRIYEEKKLVSLEIKLDVIFGKTLIDLPTTLKIYYDVGLRSIITMQILYLKSFVEKEIGQSLDEINVKNYQKLLNKWKKELFDYIDKIDPPEIITEGGGEIDLPPPLPPDTPPDEPEEEFIPPPPQPKPEPKPEEKIKDPDINPSQELPPSEEPPSGQETEEPPEQEEEEGEMEGEPEPKVPQSPQEQQGGEKEPSTEGSAEIEGEKEKSEKELESQLEDLKDLEPPDVPPENIADMNENELSQIKKQIEKNKEDIKEKEERIENKLKDELDKKFDEKEGIDDKLSEMNELSKNKKELNDKIQENLDKIKELEEKMKEEESEEKAAEKEEMESEIEQMEKDIDKLKKAKKEIEKKISEDYNEIQKDRAESEDKRKEIKKGIEDKLKENDLQSLKQLFNNEEDHNLMEKYHELEELMQKNNKLLQEIEVKLGTTAEKVIPIPTTVAELIKVLEELQTEYNWKIEHKYNEKTGRYLIEITKNGKKYKIIASDQSLQNGKFMLQKEGSNYVNISENLLKLNNEF